MESCDFCLKKDTKEKICECYLCKFYRKRMFNLCEECYIKHIDNHFKGDLTVPHIIVNDELIEEKEYVKELKKINRNNKGNNSGMF